ncbi:MAG: hypothetical protein LBF04_05380 [Prevotellaceae bacterium]|jgi:hypothetical protein|nr:hypothetical protein [Prevotellaceae bacterium]
MKPEKSVDIHAKKTVTGKIVKKDIAKKPNQKQQPAGCKKTIQAQKNNSEKAVPTRKAEVKK